MNAKTYSSYEEAAADYSTQFQVLMQIPKEIPAGVTRRGAADIPIDILISRAEKIADVSAAMIPLAKNILVAQDLASREGVSGQLLTQATAELAVAAELFHILEDETVDTTETPRTGIGRTTRTLRGTPLADAIKDLEKVMASPVSNGLVGTSKIPRTSKKAATPENAKEALKNAALTTANAISQRVVETGGEMVINLVFNNEWAAVIQAAGLLNKDITDQLNKMKKGVGEKVQSVVNTLSKTLLNVFNKILALFEKDKENKARKQIEKWLEDIQKEGKIPIFEQIIEKIYRVNLLEDKLPGWLDKTSVPEDKLLTTSSEVSELSAKFAILDSDVHKLGGALMVVKQFKGLFPQILVITTALQIASLSVLIYAGYDYIGAGQGKFINITRGVYELIRENLGI